MHKLLAPLACLMVFGGLLALSLRQPLPTASAAPLTPVITHVDAATAATVLRRPGVVVLDLRTPEEFAGGHIAGAKLLNFRAPDFKTALAQLDKGKAYLVHCASGGRSQRALATFQELGFQSVTHLDGGFEAWQAAGQAVQH